jgi:hypothetical protein
MVYNLLNRHGIWMYMPVSHFTATVHLSSYCDRLHAISTKVQSLVTPLAISLRYLSSHFGATHIFLCLAQSARWHACPQYQTRWQRPQRLRSPSPEKAPHFPHACLRSTDGGSGGRTGPPEAGGCGGLLAAPPRICPTHRSSTAAQHVRHAALWVVLGWPTLGYVIVPAGVAPSWPARRALLPPPRPS